MLPFFPQPRTIFNAEALAWLSANEPPIGASVITSLPDVSEVANLDFAGWRAWFMSAAKQIIQWVADDGVAIFFQSDIRHEGAYVDKGYLIMRAADEARAHLVWHKIVCRKPAGTIAMGRASYSHMICVSRTAGKSPGRPGPDVLPDAGFMPWPRAMGEAACRVACRFLRDETATRVVVDPFCGEGSVLAVANDYGFPAIGVDLSPKRCRTARGQTLSREPL